jgi:hypothetical protein
VSTGIDGIIFATINFYIDNTFEQNETLAPSFVYLLKLFNMLGTYKHNIGLSLLSEMRRSCF